MPDRPRQTSFPGFGPEDENPPPELYTDGLAQQCRVMPSDAEPLCRYPERSNPDS